MNETNDKELQQWLEDKQPLPASNAMTEDAAAYKTLFEILGDEPANGLPYGFTAKVTQRIQHEAKRSGEFKLYLLVTLVFVTSIVIFYGLSTFFSPSLATVMMKYKWVLVVVPVVFMAIQYLDQRLVKSNIFRG